jgi:hypothetical protein
MAAVATAVVTKRHTLKRSVMLVSFPMSGTGLPLAPALVQRQD